MTNLIAIRRALISVSDKQGLVPFAQALAERGVEILSTGGSARTLREAGVPVKEVAEHTGFPEILDGRVKTLVPQIHGGILGRRDLDEHVAQMVAHGIAPIDLVAVNLYPFEATVAKGAPDADCVENIDIGGPALIRAGAKNHDFVTVLTDPDQYGAVLAELTSRAPPPMTAPSPPGSPIGARRPSLSGCRLPGCCGRPCVMGKIRTRPPGSMPAALVRVWRPRCRCRARNCPTTT